MLKVAKIFQDNMILQREKPVAVWGSAVPGEKVTVEIQGRREQAEADKNGEWRVKLPGLMTSEDEVMQVWTEQEKLTFEDIAVGEVWLAGGQSNMEFWMRYEKNREKEFANCNNTRLRFYDVPEVCFDGQEEAFDYSDQAVWRKADCEEDLQYFSAVGYYFQKALEEKLDIPVGIIGCNWGGTSSSVWMKPESVRRAGPIWMKMYEEKAAGLDMEQYWKEQLVSPMNAKGHPFDQPFQEFILPRTPSLEEVSQKFGDMFGNWQEMQRDVLQPQTIPGCLYEHMLKKTAPFTIRGILWYQGESENFIPEANVLYKDMMTALISDWRELWQEELPFLFVQLPGYKQWITGGYNQFPVIRACQEEVDKTVEGSYMCSIADVGEEYDIHPKDKKTVGIRLSLLARRYVYGEEILADAPHAIECERNGNILTITFAHAGKEMHIEGDHLPALKIYEGNVPFMYRCNVDKLKENPNLKEVMFTAYAEGKSLILNLADCEQKIVTVAFARTDWYLVNLYNAADIPAIPFEFVC